MAPRSKQPAASGWSDLNTAMLTSAVSQAAREVRSNCCTYCIGVSSCLIAVTVGAVLQTVLSNAPIIFLREAEASQGQTDLLMYPADWTRTQFINYRDIAARIETMPNPEEYQFHTPRYEVDAVAYSPERCNQGHYQDSTAAIVPGSLAESPLVNNTWMYESGHGSNSSAEGGDYCVGTCLDERCAEAGRQGTGLILIDSAKEEAMGLGRQWTEAGSIPEGAAVLSKALATALKASVGDTVYIRVSMPYMLRHAMRPEGPADGFATKKMNDTSVNATSTTWAWADRTRFHSDIGLPVKVHAVVSSSGGKYSSRDNNMVLMEYGSFITYAASRLHPLIRYEEGVRSRANPNGDLYKYAQFIIVNLPPERRLAVYTQDNYDNIQSDVVAFSGDMLFSIGFSAIDSDTPLLDQLRSRRFVSLYLGLVLDILLMILFALSTLLIYSLLMINVQNRTFELAIRRMIGTTRAALIMLILIQAMSFVVPSLVLGLGLAQLFAWLMLEAFANLAGIPVSVGLSGSAIILGIILATAIPLLASIGPIFSAMSYSLREALDVSRAKNTAAKYTIERSNDGKISWSIVVIGTTLSVFGFAIYYLLPLSLVSMNLSLFFNIFFWILLGMLFGFVLLSLNFDLVMSRAVAFISLFWERPVMRQLTKANLVAHRMRNRKTMLMYGVALAFIVFVSTAANMEIESAEFRARQESGTELTITNGDSGNSPALATVQALENVVHGDKFEGIIEGSFWVSHHAYEILRAVGGSDMEFSNIGRVYSSEADIYAVSPNFMDLVFDDFYIPADVRTNTSLSIAEQLYTVAGSQGVVASSYIAETVGGTRGSTVLTVGSVERQIEQDPTAAGPTIFGGATTETVVNRRRTKVAGLIESVAVLDFSQFENSGDDVMVSFPHLMRIVKDRFTSVEQIPLSGLHVKLSEEASEEQLEELLVELEAAAADSPWEIELLTESLEGLDVTQTVLNFLFTTLSAVAMFLCFFSLLASMVANINEQTKQVGVLLALGLQSGRMVRVFVYEAYALVLASSLMGIGIGIVVGWTFTQQRAMFTQLPIAFFIPWDIIIAVVVGSVVASVAATAVPGCTLTRKKITALLRSV